MSKPKSSDEWFEPEDFQVPAEQPAEKARPIIVPCKLHDTCAGNVCGVMRGFGEDLVLQLHSTGNYHSTDNWDKTFRIPSSTLVRVWHTFELGELLRSRESAERALRLYGNKHLKEYRALNEACMHLGLFKPDPSHPDTFIDVLILQLEYVNPLQDVLNPTSRHQIILYIPPLNQSDAEELLAALHVTFDAICWDNTVRRMTPNALRTGPRRSSGGIILVAATAFFGAIGTSLATSYGGWINGVLTVVVVFCLVAAAHLRAVQMLVRSE
jgi:hypothetical protein